MQKLKVVVGICAVVLLICLAKLSIAETNYADLAIEPLTQSQASVTLTPATEDEVTQQETTYHSEAPYRVEATSGN